MLLYKIKIIVTRYDNIRYDKLLDMINYQRDNDRFDKFVS